MLTMMIAKSSKRKRYVRSIMSSSSAMLLLGARSTYELKAVKTTKHPTSDTENMIELEHYVARADGSS